MQLFKNVNHLQFEWKPANNDIIVLSDSVSHSSLLDKKGVLIPKKTWGLGSAKSGEGNLGNIYVCD